MLFGIMMGNYAMAGQIGLVTILPNLVIVTLGVSIAQRIGQKHTYTIFMYAAIFFQGIMTVFLIFADLTVISFSNLCGTTIAFMAIYIFLNGSKSVSNSIVVPMIADCSDYEVYRSGLYVPGFMGALFALVDQVIGALATIFVGGNGGSYRFYGYAAAGGGCTYRGTGSGNYFYVLYCSDVGLGFQFVCYAPL